MATVGRAVGLDSVTASDLWVHGVAFLRGVVAVFVARGAAGVVWSWSTDTRSG